MKLNTEHFDIRDVIDSVKECLKPTFHALIVEDCEPRLYSFNSIYERELFVCDKQNGEEVYCDLLFEGNLELCQYKRGVIPDTEEL